MAQFTATRLLFQHVSDTTKVIRCVPGRLICGRPNHHHKLDWAVHDGHESLLATGLLRGSEQFPDPRSMRMPCAEHGQSFILGQRVASHRERDLVHDWRHSRYLSVEL